jgi:hypothetical protein
MLMMSQGFMKYMLHCGTSSDEEPREGYHRGVFTALDRSYDESFPFDEYLFALRVAGYDIGLERQGTFISELTDILA